MGDNRKSVVVWIALAATVVQQCAVPYGHSPGLPDNQAYYVLLLLAVLPFNIGAIAVFARRDRPDLTVGAVAGVSLAWHVYALVNLPGVDWTVSFGYQAAQVATFGFVVVASVLPRRAEVPPPP